MDVTIKDSSDFVRLKYLQPEPDVYGWFQLGVTLHYEKISQNFVIDASGEVELRLSDLTDFVSELKHLEETRQGKAILKHIKFDWPDERPFHLEIYSTDNYGSIAMSVELACFGYTSRSDIRYQRLSLNFEIDAGMMISIRDDFIEFLDYLRQHGRASE